VLVAEIGGAALGAAALAPDGVGGAVEEVDSGVSSTSRTRNRPDWCSFATPTIGVDAVVEAEAEVAIGVVLAFAAAVDVATGVAATTEIEAAEAEGVDTPIFVFGVAADEVFESLERCRGTPIPAGVHGCETPVRTVVSCVSCFVCVSDDLARAGDNDLRGEIGSGVTTAAFRSAACAIRGRSEVSGDGGWARGDFGESDVTKKRPLRTSRFDLLSGLLSSPSLLPPAVSLIRP
jgi:hypothetical protein